METLVGPIIAAAVALFTLAISLTFNRLSSRSDFLRGKLEELGKELAMCLTEVAHVKGGHWDFEKATRVREVILEIDRRHTVCLLLATLYFPTTVASIEAIQQAAVQVTNETAEFRDTSSQVEKYLQNLNAEGINQRMDALIELIANTLAHITSDHPQLIRKPLRWPQAWM